ncbi:ubiquitin carboxyl-terminal hydrolase 42-like [Caloenas nicobarica]|uniref:ubiquitin carboxyl-terminal hydrolase 42-like n=1 Tax=Caloenas nicobarica TaxID=187106 RepID=UPI0032B7BE32
MALPERDLFPLHKICTAWQQTRSVGGGLYNLGNTCFLNSVLQCLTYTPPLANYLLSRQHSQSCVEEGFCMMCTMEVHIEEVLSCSGSAIAPTAVVNELPRIGEDFQLGAQEDAHEFFGCAVGAMQRACLSSSSSDWDTSSQATTVIDQVFGGFLRSRVTCWSCKAVSDTYEAFFDIPLDIKAASSVTGALGDFVRPEHLDGENSYKCSKCKQLVTASKRLTIHQSSSVLTVCLKRFDPFSGRKMSKVVRYPEYLDLGAYTSQAAKGPLLYSLYAVLVHEGHSCQAGHYYCFVKASDGQWYKMNDDSVDLCDIQTVLGQRTYLLFYVRHRDLTPGAGAERQETQSTWLAKLVQELKSPFSEGIVAPRKPEGEANMQRIHRNRSPQDSAGPRPQRRGRKRTHSATEEGEKLDGSHPDCPPPKHRCTGRVETQKHAHGQLARGSGILRRSSHRDRDSSGDGRSSTGEGLYGLSNHRADSHPGSLGEQQPGKYSLEQQRALLPVPVPPETAKETPSCRKRKHSCAEEGESAPQRKRRRIEVSLLVIQT